MMNSKTLNALKQSIAKWDDYTQATHRDEVMLGCFSCPLCHLFRVRSCTNCPVKKSTGKMGCQETPYEDAVDAKRIWRGSGARANFVKAAIRERDFLISLLPEGEDWQAPQ